MEIDEVFRIRIRWFNGYFEVFMIYKGLKIDEYLKIWKEIEVLFSDFDKYVEILESFGFVEVFMVFKVREKYYVEKGIIIVLDEVEGFGKFIEIEVMMERNEDVL